MTILDALVLGLVQGIAEFLPISSSGHLIIARDVLHLQVPEGLAIDAVLQLATALAVAIYFRKDLWGLCKSAFDLVLQKSVEATQQTMIYALVLGTVPAVIAGLFLESAMETLFRSAHLVAWVLMLGSLLFLLAEYVITRREVTQEMSVGRGIAIGLFQVLALVPGMSRSGATISGGMLMGLSRESAARFSFLLSVPIILGSGAKKLLDLSASGVPETEWLMIGIASLVAFSSGLLAIHFLLKFLRTHSLVPFVAYRIVLALLILVLL